MIHKIVVVGNYNWNFYEKAILEGFEANNVKALEYKIKSYSLSEKLLKLRELIKLNKLFLKYIHEQKPDAIFFYRTNEIFPKTLKKIKKELPDVKLLMYHNDNPYIGLKNKIKNYLFLNCIKNVDLVYAYRPSNIKDANKHNAKNTKLLYPYYYSKNDLVSKIDFSKKVNDVIFIGHYEENRAVSINYLITKGVNVKVFGAIDAWLKAKIKFNWSDDVINSPVFNEEYKKTLHNTKMALCFLSRINEDVYTRRNFEIPAAGTLAVSEFTPELTKLFKEDQEILFFKNNEELYTKVQNVLSSESSLKEKTLAGYNRVKNTGNSEIDRAAQILKDINTL